MDVQVPEGCSSRQLFIEAEEVLTLQTDLAGLDIEFRKLYLRYANEVPNTHAASDHLRTLWVEQQIQEKHSEFFTEFDTKRARYKGLLAKASICRTAITVLGVEQGVMIA